MPNFFYHPERARAVITTPWVGESYKPITVRSIESFFIESNMDQDADNFEIVIGDPRNHLTSLMNRDGEIRVQLFGVGLDVDYLLTGIVDDVQHSDDGRFVLTGRDRSAIAADTIAKPGKYKHQRANEFIEAQARALNITSKFALASGPVYKTIRTDGTETEWELWYRLIRKEQQWLWFTSDGRLVSSKLGYNAPPSYFFGEPKAHQSATQAKQWIPVESVSFRKTTQTRVGQVYVAYKDRNERLDSAHDSDPTTSLWEKRPAKYIESTKVSTKSGANKAVWEEIYESKVGALEIRVTIPDIGMIIRTNRMVELNIPQLDLQGKWFVVGTRIIASDNGFTQEIRLREKGYSLSRRVPSDPEVAKAPSDKPEEVAECLTLSEIPNIRWSQFFVNAAHKWQENVPYDLYLATLFGMCDVETGFRNVRRGGSIEYFKWSGKPQSGISSESEWRQTFANDPEGGIVGERYAVGPMQLYTPSFKKDADRWDGGNVNELYGNRWLPEANIMVAAEALSGKGAKSESTLWAAVRAYNGAGPVAEDYMRDVQRKVYNSPGYLKLVQQAITACNESGKFTGEELFPDLDAQAAAKELIEWKKKGWFGSYNSSVITNDLSGGSDIEKTANGKAVNGPCGDQVAISAKPLNALLFLLRNGFSCMASSLCSSHPCNVARSNRVSAHSRGLAVDIGQLGTGKGDFQNIGNGAASTRSLIIQVMRAFGGLTIEGNRPKQQIMGGNGSYDTLIQSLQLYEYEICSTCYGQDTLDDHLDHIHIGY